MLLKWYTTSGGLMAQILVPGVAQAVLSGTFLTQPWACVWHFAYDNSTASWSQTEVQALATDLRLAWAAYAAPLCTTEVTLRQVTATDIGSTTPVVGIDSNVVTGAVAGGTQTSSTCALMSFHINARYKGGHPRAYLPWGAPLNQSSEYQWSVAFQGSANSAIAALINQVRANVPPRAGNQVSQVVPRYTYQVVNDPAHSKYIRQRIGLKAVNVVTSYSLNPTLGTQRRRLHA